jgi:Tfp pilus assembly protein PilF
MQRQVEAMETDDFESLGQPVFARGFVRNYARLLGLAPEVLPGRLERKLGDRAQEAAYGLQLRKRFPDSNAARLLLTGQYECARAVTPRSGRFCARRVRRRV